MRKLLNNVLVVYKKSTYQIYFMEKKQQLADAHNLFSDADLARMRAAHEAHAGALHHVCRQLDSHRVPYHMVYRARQADYAPYSLVIAIGGDGTFIEAARRIVDTPILGVNSDPERSVGKFCATTRDGFAELLDRVRSGDVEYRRYVRMEMWVNGELSPYLALNEILLAHQSPAAMSRYVLTVGEHTEEQKSSGIWVCTAAGSTGAVVAAGGRPMAEGSRRLQYRPRELFRPNGNHAPYSLRGGLLPVDTPLSLRSRMREGMVYVDGPHLRFPLSYGNQLELRRSNHPLRVIQAAVPPDHPHS